MVVLSQLVKTIFTHSCHGKKLPFVVKKNVILIAAEHCLRTVPNLGTWNWYSKYIHIGESEQFELEICSATGTWYIRIQIMQWAVSRLQ